LRISISKTAKKINVAAINALDMHSENIFDSLWVAPIEEETSTSQRGIVFGNYQFLL
jgi:hypothetical protein